MGDPGKYKLSEINPSENKIENVEATTATDTASLERPLIINDLKVIDINSADDVRQSMKAVMVGDMALQFKNDGRRKQNCWRKNNVYVQPANNKRVVWSRHRTDVSPDNNVSNTDAMDQIVEKNEIALGESFSLKFTENLSDYKILRVDSKISANDVGPSIEAKVVDKISNINDVIDENCPQLTNYLEHPESKNSIKIDFDEDNPMGDVMATLAHDIPLSQFELCEKTCLEVLEETPGEDVRYSVEDLLVSKKQESQNDYVLLENVTDIDSMDFDDVVSENVNRHFFHTIPMCLYDVSDTNKRSNRNDFGDTAIAKKKPKRIDDSGSNRSEKSSISPESEEDSRTYVRKPRRPSNYTSSRRNRKSSVYYFYNGKRSNVKIFRRQHVESSDSDSSYE